VPKLQFDPARIRGRRSHQRIVDFEPLPPHSFNAISSSTPSA
jgi:hypothetical protein